MAQAAARAPGSGYRLYVLVVLILLLLGIAALRSNPGEGTQIRATLPVARREAERREGSPQ